MSKSGMRCQMNRKICQRNPSKKKQKSSSQYSRDWRFFYQAWWDNGYKSKHGKLKQIELAVVKYLWCT